MKSVIEYFTNTRRESVIVSSFFIKFKIPKYDGELQVSLIINHGSSYEIRNRVFIPLAGYLEGERKWVSF